MGVGLLGVVVHAEIRIANRLITINGIEGRTQTPCDFDLQQLSRGSLLFCCNQFFHGGWNAFGNRSFWT